MNRLFTKLIFGMFIFIVSITLLSNDLLGQTNWVKYDGNPVLSPGAPGSWDNYGVFWPTVIFDGTQYQMWYSGRTDGSVGHIGYATSPDGLTWMKHPNPVLETGPSIY